MSTKKSSLTYEPVSAWDSYATTTRRRQVNALAQRYIEFLSACKTERETIAYVQKRLAEAGFGEDFRKASVMRSLHGKCLFAVRKGRSTLASGVRLIAAHADSPRLDFKQRPLVEQACVVQGKTHYYGGIRKYQWLARPLALHGVVILENGKSVPVCIGEKPGDPVFTIADLLPHLAQKQSGQKVSEAFEGEKLNVVLGHSPALASAAKKEADGKDPLKAHVLQLLNEQYGIREEDLITAEIQAVPAGPARFVGLDRSLIGGYGQDDRICVFAALEALTSARAGSNSQTMAVIFWDKEEIGSDGATGASSRFLQYCMEDIPEVHEKQNAAQLGYGPCFAKFTGSRGKYGSSEAEAEFFAELRGLFNKKNIPWQVAELGKVDTGGGGTVALFLAAYGMDVIDLGPALLSMHSPFELASAADVCATVDAYRAFLEG